MFEFDGFDIAVPGKLIWKIVLRLRQVSRSVCLCSWNMKLCK